MQTGVMLSACVVYLYAVNIGVIVYLVLISTLV